MSTAPSDDIAGLRADPNHAAKAEFLSRLAKQQPDKWAPGGREVLVEMLRTGSTEVFDEDTQAYVTVPLDHEEWSEIGLCAVDLIGEQQATIATQAARIEALEAALRLALRWITPEQGPDARFFSDEFVAMASVLEECGDIPASVEIIAAALLSEPEANHG